MSSLGMEKNRRHNKKEKEICLKKRRPKKKGTWQDAQQKDVIKNKTKQQIYTKENKIKKRGDKDE